MNGLQPNAKRTLGGAACFLDVRQPLPDLDTLDRAALRDMVIRQHSQISSRDAEVDPLRLIIARLRRLQFGRKSEKIQREIEQLELQLEDLETGNAAQRGQMEKTLAPESSGVFVADTRKPMRRPLRSIFHVKWRCTNHRRKLVPLAVAV